MKKAARSILAVLLCVALLLPISANAVGPVTNKDHEAVVERLQSIEPAKVAFGIGHVDFATAKIGNKIHVYEYTNGGFSEIQTTYPLFSENSMFGLALQTDSGSFQFIDTLVDEINSQDSTHIALVYDYSSCYLYNGSYFILLRKNPYTVDTRDTLPAETSSLNAEDIVLCNLSQSTSLFYSATSIPRTPTDFICYVNWVPQGDYNICWAATVACIVNYKRGFSLTALDVVEDYYGNYTQEDLDNGLDPSLLPNFMDLYYQVSYTFRNQTPTSSVVLENILADNPIYCSFVNGSDYHAVTIRGINRVSNIIYIMEPNNGSSSAEWSNGVWRFQMLGCDGYWTSCRALCHSW